MAMLRLATIVAALLVACSHGLLLGSGLMLRGGNENADALVHPAGRDDTWQVPACNARAGYDCSHLTAVTPSWSGHLHYWSRMMESILKSLPERAGSCGFECVRYQTVVTTDEEKTLFLDRLDELGNGTNWSVHRPSGMAHQCGVGSRLRDLIRINTVVEVLEMANASVPANITSHRKDSSMKKEWIQIIKKMYGCMASPDGVCVLLDSEGEVMRNNICHAASAYMAKKTVAISPYPGEPFGHREHKKQVELSRELLNATIDPPGCSNTGGCKPDERVKFGNFYAMENYHWFFEKHIVRDFLQHVPIGTFATQEPYKKLKPFVEEAYYHFIYSRADLYPGYNFVNVYEEMEKALGPAKWRQLVRINDLPGKYKAIFEISEEYLRCIKTTPVEQANIARIYRDNGLLLSRCRWPPSEAYSVVMEGLDMCISSNQSPLPEPLPLSLFQSRSLVTSYGSGDEKQTVDGDEADISMVEGDDAEFGNPRGACGETDLGR